MSDFKLNGKRALVTGGSRGIGLGIAEALAGAGADTALMARNSEELARAAERVATHGTEVHTASVDLADLDGIAAAYDTLSSQTGGFDILVNNAGVNHRAPAEALSLELWQKTMDLNVSAVFAMSQVFARARIAAKAPGRIINIASLMSAQTRPGVSAYTASKGAIKQLTQALAVDWAPYGILVNAIGPGYIRTPLTEPLANDPEFSAWVEDRCPLGRWGEPRDIGRVAVFLASEAASFVTGQTLYVDGGWLARF